MSCTRAAPTAAASRLAAPAASARRVAAAWVLTLCMLRSAAAADGPLEGCGGDRVALQRGEVLVVDREPTGGSGVALRACGLIDTAPAAVWSVLRDCGAYQQFLPGVSRSEMERPADGVAFCDEVIDLPFPLGDLRSLTRVVETRRPDGGFERRWTLVRGGYRRLDGAWTLLPWQAGERTLAIYDLDMDPDTVIPDFLLRGVQSSTAPDIFAAIRRRVQHCAAGTDPACAAE